MRKKLKMSAMLMAVIMGISLVGCTKASQTEPVNTQSETETPTEESASQSTEETAGSKQPTDEAAETGNEKNPSDITIAVIDKSSMHQYHRTLKTGCEAAAEELGINLAYDAPENATYIDKQVEMLQAAIDTKPDAICLAALDAEAVILAVQKADELGIPIICYDNGINSDIPMTTIATNDLDATKILAVKMGEAIGGNGKILVLGHDQTSKNGIERRDGFVNAMKEQYSNIEIAEIQYAMDQLKATDTAKSMLLANPDAAGIYGTNESTVIGILNAVKELELEGKVTVMGYDSGAQQIAAIRSGEEAGAITQNPYGQGYDAIVYAYKVIMGEEIPKTVDAAYFYYNAENIDEEEVARCLYE